MIIKSKFKDYYDYVANQYGGGDPGVLYLRKEIQETVVSDREMWSKISSFPADSHYYGGGNGPKGWYDYRWLVVAGRYFLLLKKNHAHPAYDILSQETFHVLSEDLHADVFDKLMVKKDGWFQKTEEKLTVDYYINRQSDALIALSKKVNAPVFVINALSRGGNIHIDERTPVLKDLGVASHISAEQVYQEIAYFLSNVLVDSPDVRPPVHISDKDMIVSKGFDLKQSFRHRK